MIENKDSRIRDLEFTISEFEDFLKENPDVRDLRTLKKELADRDDRVAELENWIERNDEIVIEKERIIELEEMVTNLEDYVKSHDVDELRSKLRESEKIIEELKTKEKISEKSMDDMKFEEKSIFQKNDKIVELEKKIFEKDEEIANCRIEINESRERVGELRKEMMKMASEIANYEAQDIDVLKEEIRVRDEKVNMLEEEIDSLERAFSERIDLEQFDDLVKLVKHKEEMEKDFEINLKKERDKNEELTEALRGSVLITSESENKLRRVSIDKKKALDRVAKLEQRIASMQTACALKCQTCRPLLYQLQKSERKLDRLVNEKRSQLRDLRQMKREALRAALSEKDAHLALLELSGLKTSTQIEQADKLRGDKARLLEKLKQEDKRSIEQSEDSDDSSSTTSTGMLTKILEPPLAIDEDYDLDGVCETKRETEKDRNVDHTNGHTDNEGENSFWPEITNDTMKVGHKI